MDGIFRRKIKNAGLPMIVDREIISKNFRYMTNEFNHRYGFDDERVTNRKGLFKRIDYWKYVLYKECGMRKGNKIALGITQIGLDYIAVVFAAMELGLQFVVLDFSISADRIGINDFKTDAFGKIDLFLHHFPDGDENLEYYSKKSLKTVHMYDVNDLTIDNIELFQNISERRPEPSDPLMLATSSGTTGTPKRVVHTHEFMYQLIQRNKKQFIGSVMHIRNLHHGSSMAVFFLPTLASDDVTVHYGLGYNIADDGMVKIAAIANQYKIENISFPYTYDLDLFLKQSVERGYKYINFNAYTLSYIREDWKQYFEPLGISKIESIFGCNETSGPLFVSRLLSHQNFDPKAFVQLDNFYKFSLDKKNMLTVHMPVYNVDICMNDTFKNNDGIWYHTGRHDITRINDVEIDLGYVMQLANKYNIDGVCINDPVFNKIYFALWENMTISAAKIKVGVLSKDLNKKYGARVSIDQYSVLNKNDFMRGIKLDHELIREWFRNNH